MATSTASVAKATARVALSLQRVRLNLKIRARVQRTLNSARKIQESRVVELTVAGLAVSILFSPRCIHGAAKPRPVRYAQAGGACQNVPQGPPRRSCAQGFV